MTIVGIAAVIASALVASRPASGQESGRIVIDADECVDLASADARLACYDRRAEAARRTGDGATAPNDAVKPSANAEPAAAAAATAGGDSEVSAASESLGRGDERGSSDAGAIAEPASASSTRAEAPPATRDARSADRDDGDVIVATIADLRETLPDAYLITLENGQIWRQVQPKRYPLRPGDEVRIYVSRWGSYRLESDGPQTFIQVERVR